MSSLPFLCSRTTILTSRNGTTRTSVKVDSPEIAAATLHRALPWYTYLYTVPFLSLYPLLAYAYYVRYDDWLQSEEWTFLACVSLGAGHALSFLATRWSTGAKAWITTRKVCLSCISLFFYSFLAEQTEG
jgi:hypothetical protein